MWSHEYRICATRLRCLRFRLLPDQRVQNVFQISFFASGRKTPRSRIRARSRRAIRQQKIVTKLLADSLDGTAAGSRYLVGNQISIDYRSTQCGKQIGYRGFS